MGVSTRSSSRRKGKDSAPPALLGKLVAKLGKQREDPCFAQTARLYALGKIDLDNYLRRILTHLKVSGPLHKTDNSPADLADLFCIDLVSGAVKATILSPDFAPLPANEVANLNRICTAVFSIPPSNGDSDDRTAFITRTLRGHDTNLDELKWLSATSVGIIAMVCYARRLPLTLELILNEVPHAVPENTVFDLLPADIPRYRTRQQQPPDEWFEHVPPSSRDGDLERQLWAVLASKFWFHGSAGERVGDGSVPSPAVDLTSDKVRLTPKLEALARKRGVPMLDDIDRFLSGPPRAAKSKPCTLAEAERLLTLFPLKRLVETSGGWGGVYQSDAGLNLPGVLVGVARWPKSNPDRLKVMRMILDQGVDPDSNEPDFGGISCLAMQGTPLPIAAKRGDVKMVKLLLEKGSRDTQRAVEVARAAGHAEVLNLLTRTDRAL